MKKYYIEIWDNKNHNYVVQSSWFDTEEQALKWADNVFFIRHNLQVCLMSSEWDTEMDTYTDILLERIIREY